MAAVAATSGRHRGALAALAILVGLVGARFVALASAREAVDFVREVRPILVEHCYECHGPDKRKGGLRLTNRRDAFLAGDYGVPVIEPSHSDLSYLFELVTSEDPKERMPKEKSPLSAEKIDIIRRWIGEGAVWPAEADAAERHWAYQRPVRPVVPTVRDASWPRNEIDAFVLSRLESEGWRPAPPADPATLIRRVSFDLIGLPPTPAEIDAFVAAPSRESYEAVVDRLLASPRYGERWAIPWLDLARYADSTGFQTDQLLPLWPYRDWVIEALNADMPYDQFTVEQIAGDLLPNATIEQRVATGFQRAAPLNLESGALREEIRVAQVIDRVNTMSTIWLGSTIECAQCHNHKFDPITQEEYYRLFSFFNNAPEEATVVGRVAYRPGGPAIQLAQSPERLRAKTELVERLRALIAEAGALAPSADPNRAKMQRAFLAAAPDQPPPLFMVLASSLLRDAAAEAAAGERAGWEDRMRKALARGEPRWEPLAIESATSTGGETLQRLDDGSLLIGGAVPDTSTYEVKVRTRLDGLTGFKLETLKHRSLPGGGPGRGDDERSSFVLSEFEVARGSDRRGDPPAPIRLGSVHSSRTMNDGPPDAAIDRDPATGWMVTDPTGQPPSAVFSTEQPIAVSHDGTTLVFTLQQNAGFGQTIGRLRLLATNAAPELVAMPPQVAWSLLAPTPTKSGARATAAYFAQCQVDPERARSVLDIIRELEALTPPSAPVMEELAEPRKTHVLKRGSYLTPAAEVSAGTPAVLHRMPEDLPRNRLGLARWLVDPANPLIGRVTVNRWWAELFGRGLVKTLEDFGLQGERPTHPELLDWLAIEFVEGGWSQKKLLRKIVTSATYQQASRPSDPELASADPENLLLARNPRLRLPAELIRDNALAISGLLSAKMGGPPVYPPQPDGIWKLTGSLQSRYVPSSGEDLLRRGVYTIWRRSSPYPSFINFDARDRASCLVKRARTNTPLQALTLLNDQAYVEAALAMGGRILAERPGDDTAGQLRYGFRLALGREPTAAELAELAALLAEQQDRIRAEPGKAQAIVEAAQSFDLPEPLDPERLAAWFFVANALLNLDETITRG